MVDLAMKQVNEIQKGRPWWGGEHMYIFFYIYIYTYVYYPNITDPPYLLLIPPCLFFKNNSRSTGRIPGSDLQDFLSELDSILGVDLDYVDGSWL